MLSRLTTTLLFAASLTLSTQAQVSLATLVEEASAGWFFGSWKATTDDGSTLDLKVSWDLNKKLAVLEVKTPDMNAKGFTVLEPGAELPTYFGADDRGSVSKGNWNYEDGALVLRIETSRPYESPMKWAAVFAGNSSTGLELRLHGLESWGGLVYPANSVLKFKKQ